MKTMKITKVICAAVAASMLTLYGAGTMTASADMLNGRSDSEFYFSDLTGWQFAFSSGAGAWSTLLTVNPDGSFEGQFGDSDMGSSGEGYPYGTRYFCNFTGHFTMPSYSGDYTWIAQIADIQYKDAPGSTFIADGVRYVASTPYGLENAHNIYFYLPGKYVSTLPQDYRDWVRYQLDGQGSRLPFYGIYNAAEAQGFSSYYDANINAAQQARYGSPQAASSAKRSAIAAAFARAEQRSSEIDYAFANTDMNQVTMNLTASEQYELWDHLLNQIWAYLKETLPADQMEALRTRQRAWIREKEDTANRAAAGFTGGSMEPMVRYRSMAGTTERRVREWVDLYQLR